MFLSANINQYRSCRNVAVNDFGAVIALIGRNGVGKTNIMKAIEWAAATGSAAVPQQLMRNNSVRMTLSIAEGVFVYDLAVLHDSDSKDKVGQNFLVESLSSKRGNEEKRIFERRRERLDVDGQVIELGSTVPAMPAILSLLPNHPNASAINHIVTFLEGVCYYSLDSDWSHSPLVGVIDEAEFESWMANKQKKQLSPDRILMLELLHLYLKNKDSYNLLVELTGPNGLGVVQSIDCIPINFPVLNKSVDNSTEDQINKQYYIFQFAPTGSVGKHGFDFVDLSFGTQRIFRLMISLLHDKSSVALIEQPEDGIHPGLLHKLIPLLRSNINSTQFMFSSHSPDVLDRMDPSEVRLVEMDQGITKLRALSEMEVRAACTYMKKDGPFSDFLISIQD